MAANYIMALDLGTTGNRAMIFDRQGAMVGQAYRELTQYYPQPGWVEHNPCEIWDEIHWAMGAALAQARLVPTDIAALGLTVQRETCLLWNRLTGRPLANAIVWQDRRTAPQCNALREAGWAEEIYDRTGLILDAYFSATKLAWLLDQAQRETDSPVDFDQVLAGTIDSWVLWHLTGQRVHATDHSNASRTLLLNLATGQWDEVLLSLFGIPRSLLPEVRPSLGFFGYTDGAVFGAEVPIMAILGDQQAALFGQGCDRPGLLKCTYGTGAFLVAHTGERVVRSTHQLLSTIAWSEGTADPNRPHLGYAIEGSLFTAGACIQWLRDGLQLISSAAETESLAQRVTDNGGVYFVPALSGLGAPHWDMAARGAFLGLTSAAQREHLVRAVLEAIAYQVKEVVAAVNQDIGTPVRQLKVDGGACHNNFLMQFQADVLGIPIVRPQTLDVTAQGAAFAAGLATGFWPDYQTLVQGMPLDQVFEPGVGQAQAQAQFAQWQRAVERAKGWAT